MPCDVTDGASRPRIEDLPVGRDMPTRHLHMGDRSDAVVQ